MVTRCHTYYCKLGTVSAFLSARLSHSLCVYNAVLSAALHAQVENDQNVIEYKYIGLHPVCMQALRTFYTLCRQISLH